MIIILFLCVEMGFRMNNLNGLYRIIKISILKFLSILFEFVVVVTSIGIDYISISMIESSEMQKTITSTGNSKNATKTI